MKKYRRLKITGISILLLITFYYLSCDIKSPVENVDVIFNTLPISTVISGNIVDVATGEPIQGKTVYLSIEGDNKSEVVTLTSTPQTEFSTTVGFVDFALVETANPSQSTPVKLIIVAKCTGYLTNTLPFSISDTGDANFTIPMVNEGNLPTGAVNATSTGQTDNSGVVQSAINVTAHESQANVSASIYIPKGAVLMDANGNVLKGSVTASFTYFNNQNDESLSCLPGGYSVSTIQNGVKSDGVFLTAGFFNLSIKDAYGVEAKRVSKQGFSKIFDGDTVKPLITVEIPPSTINPETGVAVKAGDSIDVWSIDQTTSIWNHENKVLIKGPNVNGNFFVQFYIDHLSFYNLDWYGYSCYYGITINLIGKPTGRQITLVLSGLSGSYHTENITSDNKVTLLLAPANMRAKITAYDATNCGSGNQLGSIIIDNLCSSVPVNLYLNYSEPSSSTTNIVVNVEGFCLCNSHIIVRPNGNPIWYRIDGSCYSNWSFAGNLFNGSITILGIQIGLRYVYATWYEGEWYTIGATVYGDHAEIDPGLSSQNIVSAQVANSNGYTTLKFSGRLSNNVCANFCRK